MLIHSSLLAKMPKSTLQLVRLGIYSLYVSDRDGVHCFVMLKDDSTRRYVGKDGVVDLITDATEAPLLDVVVFEDASSPSLQAV